MTDFLDLLQEYLAGGGQNAEWVKMRFDVPHICKIDNQFHFSNNQFHFSKKQRDVMGNHKGCPYIKLRSGFKQGNHKGCPYILPHVGATLVVALFVHKRMKFVRATLVFAQSPFVFAQSPLVVAHLSQKQKQPVFPSSGNRPFLFLMQKLG